MCLLALLVVLWCAFMNLAGVEEKPPLPDEWEGMHVRVSGQVYKQDTKKKAYYLKDISIESSMRISYKSNILVYTKEAQDISIGNTVEAEGVCAFPEVASNPGQFSMETYYAQQNIYIMIKKAKVRILDENRNWYADITARLQESFGTQMDAVGGTEAMILKAMLLGDKSDLDEELKSLYRIGGISHILAISGLHISFIGTGLFRLLRKAGRSFRTASAVSAVFLISYGAISGMPVSAKRAILMFLVYLGAQVLGRTYDMLSGLALAAVLILLEEPRCLVQAGFLLSFLAVLGLGAIYPVWKKMILWKHKVWQGLFASLSIQAATLPAVLYFFFEVSPYGLLLNLLVLPLMPLLLCMGGASLLLSYISLDAGVFFFAPCHYIAGLYRLLCEKVSGLPGAVLVLGRPQVWCIAAYYGILIAITLLIDFVIKRRERCLPVDCHMKGRISVKWMPLWIWGLGTCMAFLLLGIPMKAVFSMVFLDVGQGDSIFWKTPEGTTFLCDAGSSTVSEVGRYRISPFLKWAGIGTLDYLILTHMDADHINGAKELLEDSYPSVTIKTMVLPDIHTEDETFHEIEHMAREKNIFISYLKKGDVLREGPMEVRCLAPQSGKLVGEKDKNEASLVLEAGYGDFTVLLTGDLEGRGEEELLKSGLLRRVDLLKTAHHGSRGATSERFLEEIRPMEAVISYGDGNSYGHPHEELQERLSLFGVHVRETAKQGAVTVTTDGEFWSISGYLDEKRKRKIKKLKNTSRSVEKNVLK